MPLFSKFTLHVACLTFLLMVSYHQKLVSGLNDRPQTISDDALRKLRMTELLNKIRMEQKTPPLQGSSSSGNLATSGGIHLGSRWAKKRDYYSSDFKKRDRTVFKDVHLRKDEAPVEWDSPPITLDASSSSSSSACDFTVVNVTTYDLNSTTTTITTSSGNTSHSQVVMGQFPVRAAQGLLNMKMRQAQYYVVQSYRDVRWKELLLSNCTEKKMTPTELIMEGVRVMKKVIRYDSEYYAATLTSIAVMAGVLEAIPLNEEQYVALNISSMVSCGQVEIVLDTRGQWLRAETAVNYTVQHALQNTSTYAFLNISSEADIVQTDFVVSRKLFAQYLSNSCVPGHEHNRILVDLVAQAPWPRPIRGFGYNSQDFFLGYLYEANTNCIDTMGEICTLNTRNLGFWQYFGQPLTLENPLPKQAPSPHIEYNPKKKYVALLYGDMDNMEFVQSIGREHMDYRMKHCNADSGNYGNCFPLSWTLSSNLMDVAPEIMRWFYNSGLSTGGRDWFIFPPSGTMYGYPSEMPLSSRMGFIERQTHQSIIMNTTGSVDWEWFYNWDKAFENYFPYYVGKENSTRAFFLDDVPWPVPIPPLLFDEYKVWGFNTSSHPVVAFRPAFGWQEVVSGGGGVTIPPKDAAELINLQAPGCTTYVYVIQNTPIQDIFEMVKYVNSSEVELVGYEQLMNLAFQREALRQH